jgi:hypothetical protein
MKLPPGHNDLTHHRYGYLIVLRISHIRLRLPRRDVYWKCLCTCGRTTSVIACSLISGNTRSCGCLQLLTATTHGHCSQGKISPEHAAWNSMLNRCGPCAKGALRRHYYARGIRVCKRWHRFKAFLQDMGLRPGKGYSIERINNNIGYSPSNCRWATLIDQANNMRSNRLITYMDKTLTLAQWCRALGLPYQLTWSRLCKRGWAIERAFGVAAP